MNRRIVKGLLLFAAISFAVWHTHGKRPGLVREISSNDSVVGAVYANRSIRKGSVIRREDLQVRPVKQTNIPMMLTSINAVSGMVATEDIEEGRILSPDLLSVGSGKKHDVSASRNSK